MSTLNYKHIVYLNYTFIIIILLSTSSSEATPGSTLGIINAMWLSSL